MRLCLERFRVACSFRDARNRIIGDGVFFTTRRLTDGFTITDDLVFSINGDDWADSVTVEHSVLEVADDGKVTISDKSIVVDGNYSITAKARCYHRI